MPPLFSQDDAVIECGADDENFGPAEFWPVAKCVMPMREEVKAYVTIVNTFVAAAKGLLDATNAIVDKPWPIAAAVPQNVCEQINNIVTDEGQGLMYAIEDAETIAWVLNPAETPAEWVKDVFSPKSRAKEVAAPAATSRPSIQRRPQPALAIKEAKGKQGQPVDEIDGDDA
jgi:hypothetical protein